MGQDGKIFTEFGKNRFKFVTVTDSGIQSGSKTVHFEKGYPNREAP